MNHLKGFDEYRHLDENVYSTPDWKDMVRRAKEVATTVIDKGEQVLDKGLDKVDDFIGRSYNVDKSGLMFANKIARHLSAEAEPFKAKVIEVSKKLGIHPNWLLAVIDKESEFNPRAANPSSSARGLLQILNGNCKPWGITSDQLGKMSGVQQLDYIYKYFAPYRGKMSCYQDVYLVVYAPGYFKFRNDPNKIISNKATTGINKTVDVDGNGTVSMGDFKKYAMKGLPANFNNPPKS